MPGIERRARSSLGRGHRAGGGGRGTAAEAGV